MTCIDDSCGDGGGDVVGGSGDVVSDDANGDIGHDTGDSDDAGGDSDVDDPLRIFPGAYGYGSKSRGAYQLYAETRDPDDLPKILYVDSLDGGNASTGEDSGTLKWCLSQTYPRIILFKKGGLIDWSSNASDYYGGDYGNYFSTLDSPYCNVYGQSAPWPGITITNGGLLLIREHDFLIQHLRFRIGDNDYTNGKQTSGIACWSGNHNIVVDHCSFSWSIDQFFGANPAHDITLNNNIFAEALNCSTHPTPGDECHAMGNTFMNSQQISSIGNLYAHLLARAPYFNSGITNVYVANNLMYNIQNWGTIFQNAAHSDVVTLVDFIGNYYVAGTDTMLATGRPLLIKGDATSGSNFYVSDNFSTLTTVQLDMVNNESAVAVVQTTTPNTDDLGYTPHNVGQVPEFIYANAGAFFWHRDETDTRILMSIKNQTGTLIDSVDDLEDTFLDITETTHTLDLPAAPHGDADGDGYTDLEEWVAGLRNDES